MERYIAMLRGINVSGSKGINMNSLKQAMIELHLENIETYIQSGNLVFDYPGNNEAELAVLITDKIQKTFGFQVPVIVKTAQELESVVNHNPFIAGRNEDIDKLHVTFFSQKPAQLKQDNKSESFPDEFIIEGNAAYLFCPNGYGRTKLSNQFFERKLGVTATTRNWKTVVKLNELAGNKH